MKYVLIILLSVGLIVASRGGPDEEGYRWVDSDERDGPRFDWIEISGSGTEFVPTRDDANILVDLPGSFPYYGSSYDQLTICTNGWAAFGSWYSTTSYFYGIPYTSYPNAALIAYGMDFDPTREDGAIYYGSVGSRFVIEWSNVCEYGHYSGGTSTFEIIIDYARAAVFFQYLEVTSPEGIYTTAYTGIENSTGTVGLLFGRTTTSAAAIKDSLSIVFRDHLVVRAPWSTSFTYLEDFDMFTFPVGTGWEIGIPHSGPGSAYSFPRCVATRLDSDYDDGVNWFFYTPYLDLVDASTPLFTFYQWYNMESGCDGGMLELSTDEEESWTPIEPEGGYPVVLGSDSPLPGFGAFSGISSGWEQVTFNLSAYRGSEPCLRFHFLSNGSGTAPGWYIDDMGLIEPFGVVEGICNLLYRDDNTGAMVSDNRTGRWTGTLPDGSFVLDSVLVGDFYIKGSMAGYLDDSVAVHIDRGETVYVELLLSPLLYFCDFEDTSGGWVASPEGGWEWGEPASDIDPGGAHSGQRLWGTKLDGNYFNNADWHLDLTIDLDFLEHPALGFFSWYRFSGEYLGTYWDGGNVQVSTDGGESWDIVNCIQGYDGISSEHNENIAGQLVFGGESTGDYWHYTAFDLTAYAHSVVTLRLEVASDGFRTSRGWYIDDAQIADYCPVAVEEERSRPSRLDTKVYPNPFNSAFTISLTSDRKENAVLTMFDISGVTVFKRNIGLVRGENRFSISPSFSLTSGVYIVNIHSEDGNYRVKKVVLIK